MSIFSSEVNLTYRAHKVKLALIFSAIIELVRKRRTNLNSIHVKCCKLLRQQGNENKINGENKINDVN